MGFGRVLLFLFRPLFLFWTLDSEIPDRWDHPRPVISCINRR